MDSGLPQPFPRRVSREEMMLHDRAFGKAWMTIALIGALCCQLRLACTEAAEQQPAAEVEAAPPDAKQWEGVAEKKKLLET